MRHAAHVRVKHGYCDASSRDLESCLFLPQHAWFLTKNALKTTSRQSYGHHTSTTMSVCVEYVTDMKRTHTTGEEQLFFPMPSFFYLPPALSFSHILSLLMRIKENDVIIFTANYQRQTPCKQLGQAELCCSSNAA